MSCDSTPGRADHDQELALALEDVDRRLPARAPAPPQRRAERTGGASAPPARSSRRLQPTSSVSDRPRSSSPSLNRPTADAAWSARLKCARASEVQVSPAPGRPPAMPKTDRLPLQGRRASAPAQRKQPICPRLETDVLADVDLLTARRRHLDVVLVLARSLAQRELQAPRRPEAVDALHDSAERGAAGIPDDRDLIRPHEQAGGSIRQALRIEVELASRRALPASMVMGTVMKLLANLGVVRARQHKHREKIRAFHKSISQATRVKLRTQRLASGQHDVKLSDTGTTAERARPRELVFSPPDSADSSCASSDATYRRSVPSSRRRRSSNWRGASKRSWHGPHTTF